MSMTDTGRAAEASVACYLRREGYKILAQNWRTRWCEIDIIATKNHTVYFVEVKHRQTNLQGDGLEYITAKKLQQMSFAAEIWVHNQRWDGEYALAAASVSGSDYRVGAFIEL